MDAVAPGRGPGVEVEAHPRLGNVNPLVVRFVSLLCPRCQERPRLHSAKADDDYIQFALIVPALALFYPSMILVMKRLLGEGDVGDTFSTELEAELDRILAEDAGSGRLAWSCGFTFSI